MRHLTIRSVPSEIARALEKEKRRRGVSLNQTVIDVLGQGLGVGGSPVRRNGLKRLAGTWTEAEHQAFEDAIAPTEQIDEELWR